MIDIGCGRGIIGAIVRIYREPNRLVGIDIFKPYLDFCHKINVYDELYELDLRKTPLPFDEKEFAVTACIEVIEHVPKENGLKLLKELERIAKIVIVSAPNVFFYQKAYDNNPFQKHVSECARALPLKFNTSIVTGLVSSSTVFPISCYARFLNIKLFISN